MFSILQKPQDTVNAEDLEILQNEIERRLVDVVTQRWKLERELDALNITSPDSVTNPPTSSVEVTSKTVTSLNSSSHQPTTSLPSGKVRNSLKLNQIESTDNTSDGFKGSPFISVNNGNNSTNNNNGASGSASGANSNETDSVSSESSLVSNLTGSTIITAALPDLGSQAQTNNLNSNKRSLKNSSNDRPSKRFRQDSSNSLRSTSSYPKRPPHSKHRPKVVPVS